MMRKKSKKRGFPGGSEVKKSSANVADTCSIPDPGRCHNYGAHSRAPRAATAEALELESLCSASREATAVRSPCTTTRQEPPLAATREKACIAMKTQHRQK